MAGAFVAAATVSQGDAAAGDHPTGEPNELCDAADGRSATPPASLRIEDLEREVACGRSSFGWDAHSSVVKELAADPIAWCRGADIGLPITEVEAGELAARSEVQTAALQIADELRAENDPDFAGVWLEFNTSTLWISYTSDKASLNDELSTRLPNGGRVAFQAARYSYADLEAVAAAVVDGRFEVSDPAGVPVFGGGVDEVANSVVVLTDDAGNSDEYGIALGSYAGTDSSLFTFETYLGDAELESSAKSGDRWGDCSFGPYGWVPFFGGRLYYGTTAGHCDDTGYHWAPNPDTDWHNPVWTMQRTTAWSTPPVSADAQAMLEETGGLPVPSARVRTWHSSDLILGSVTPSGQGHDTVGAIVCHTGWVTRGVNNCGDIDSPRLFNCGSYQNMRRARTPEENEYSSTNGDSGGDSDRVRVRPNAPSARRASPGDLPRNDLHLPKRSTVAAQLGRLVHRIVARQQHGTTRPPV